MAPVREHGLPLTLALSPSAGEREKPRRRCRKAETPRIVERLTRTLPLPRRGGEGWAAPLGRALLIPLLLAAFAGGCVSKSKARAEAQKAYMAGQQAAMARMQAQNSVTVNGPVRNSVVPWTEGMTLAKALAAAEYYGKTDPSAIIVVHNGIGRRYDPKEVLKGVDVPLEPGDAVQLIP